MAVQLSHSRDQTRRRRTACIVSYTIPIYLIITSPPPSDLPRSKMQLACLPPYPCALVAESRRANLFFPPAHEMRDERSLQLGHTAHRQDQVAAPCLVVPFFQRHCIVSRGTRPPTIAVYKLSLSCSSQSHSCKQIPSSRHHRLSFNAH
jgi:hypothetical protein